MNPVAPTSGGRSHLLQAAVCAIALSLVGGSLITSALAAAGCAGRRKTSEIGEWVQVNAPTFAAGGDAITAHAVDPIDPALLYVSNGTVVLKSLDGGCEWTEVFSVATAPQPEFPGFNATTTVITEMTIPASARGRETIYLLAGQVGTATTVVVSRDGGLTWTVANQGLPVTPGQGLGVAASPQDPATVYVSASMAPRTGTGVGYGLFRSMDYGATWALMTQPGDLRGAPWRHIEVDPLNPDHVWAWGNGCVCLSHDGGATIKRLLTPEGDVPALDIFHVPGRPARLFAFAVAPPDPTAGPQVYYRSDDGGAEWTTGQTPAGVVSAVGRGSREIFAATVEPSSRSVIGSLVTDDEWSPLAGGSFPLVRDLTSGIEPDSPVVGNAGDALVIFMGRLGPAESPLAQFIVTPGRNSSTIRECPPPGPPAHWRAGWDPAPANEPVYVTNFDTGYTVKYDSHGSGTIVALAPRYSEGMTLDPFGRLISTTRFSNQVTRLDPDTCKLEVLDFDLFGAEGPTYDRDRNLYVVDSNNYYVYRYSWPQYPRQVPELVWRMPGFLEDLKFGPPGHPYEDHLFVLYRDRRQDVDDPRVCNFAPCPLTGNPNAIALLEPTDDPEFRGFKRLPTDFAHLGPGGMEGDQCTGFQSLGMAFLPDGHLLVPDACGSGVIRDYAPDGSFQVWARVTPPAPGVLMLTKIAVTGTGHVYITGNTSGCAPGENRGSWLFRFDGEGRELEPPFTQHLSCAVGIAAPSTPPLTQLPPPLKKELPREPLPPEDPRPDPPLPVRGAVVAPMPPPPPPIVVPAPVPGPAPVVEMAPAPAPNPAPAQAANPMAAAVPQEQEQPQMAFVTAANLVSEQVEQQYAMARVSRPADPWRAARFVATSGSLMVVLAFGYLTLAAARARARVRLGRDAR